MDFTSVSIIVICCYIVGEIYKLLFKNKTNLYKFIPILVTITGGIIGILIFYTAPEMICYVNNVWMALEIGIISGASSTGTNQIIKQLFNKK